MSGRSASSRRATYEDLCQVASHKVAEILDGELIVTPRPALRHARASSGLGGYLWGPFQGGRDGPGGWWILDEPELHLGDDILVPDLAGWRRDRLPAIPDAAYMTLAPDWVCEVISPSTERMDRSRKLRIYAREGVPHLWLLDPIVRTLEVLRLENARWVLLETHSDTDVVRVEPFAAIEIALTALWPDSPPESPSGP
jgi:Uma2 family endonuclease